jgi:hypothetical protein
MWIVIPCAIVLLFAASLQADPKPLSKEEQAKVDKAVAKGVTFLKGTQRDKGNWILFNKRLGQTVLAAYALLEAGVPVNDPAIQKAAEFIRKYLPQNDKTYETALSLLFLDRLGDPQDKPLIRSLTLQIIAGQCLTGGWGYTCSRLNKSQEDILCKSLEELIKRQRSGEVSTSKLLKDLGLPRQLGALAVFRDPRTLPWRDLPRRAAYQNPKRADRSPKYENPDICNTAADNSNTQFALLGLWTAKRHELPVEPTLHLVVERFERSQYADGWWPYGFGVEPARTRRPSMICVGLMGLAVGRGLKMARPGAARPGAVDLPVLKGLAALSQDLDFATAGLERSVAPRGSYYLWSLERVAMLYDLPTIGDKDWYHWGVGILLASQELGGEWREVMVSGKEEVLSWGPVINTSLALLFLKHSHPMKELTPKLPFKAKELNQGIARLLSRDPPLEPATNHPSRSEKSKR